MNPAVFLSGLLVFCLAFLFFEPKSYALSSAPQKDEAVQVRLVSGIDGTGQESTVPLGLDVELAPGWHTYWRSPGMAGLPPQIDWKDSQTTDGNLKSAELFYPAPKRYIAYGLETIGYEDHVLFPINAAVQNPGQPLTIKATLDLLVCSSICLPKNFALALTIPAGAANESAEASLIKQFRDQLPVDAAQSGLVVKDSSNDGEYLILQVDAREALTAPDLFVENAQNISFTAPEIKISEDGHSVQFKTKPADTLPKGATLAGLPLTLTIVNGEHALQESLTVPAPVTSRPAPAAPPLPLWSALIFAVIGGFILNLMPCVLPVLSMKILSVVSHGGGTPRRVRQSFLTTAAGILFSFLSLAIMTLLLKVLGLSVGWGVQFQQPVFLTCLILLLTFFAANMWGLFEIRLPGWLAGNLSDAAYHPKLAGDFATGAFATLLATPCTAPFLGTAVGFALASGPADILMIFSALGCGMVLPYLLIAACPRFATLMPRPGAWMIVLRNILGLALASTAFWLVWVLAAQITPRFAAVVGLSMAGIVVLMALSKTTISKRLIRLGMMDFALVALGVTVSGAMIPKAPPVMDSLWLPFNERAIAADIDEGKTVFVDITADWCLTCKANKKFILSQSTVADRLFHSDIIAMQADWTNPDPIITAFLHHYGRYGIPFNAVFGPGAPQGILLPELLTAKDVNKALDKAAVKPPAIE